jgi:hypothetical protein
VWGWIGDTESRTFDDSNIAPLTSDAAAKDRQPFQRVNVAITGITKANPAVVTTATPHGYSNGDRVTMVVTSGMTELNGRAYFVDNVTTNTFELVGVDSTSYGTFINGLVHKSGNYPQAVTYHQQRQIFANTYSEPQTIYTTRVGDFNSLRTSNPTRDDDAITVTINASQVNEIRHIVPLSSLVILTSGAEWALTEGQDGVLTPATIGVSVQSYNGCSWTRPVTIDNNVIYVQEKGAKLRDLGYEWTSETYSGNDLSIMSSHLFQGYEIEEMTYADEPYGIVWCVRSDGALLGLTYQREHQVWAWHVHGTFGWFESVTTISEDGRDALYAIVRRVDPGSSNVRRYIERMEPRYTDASENAFCVDSGLTYNGAPATTITGLDHLEGNFVSILADGVVVPIQQVVSGQITLPRAASIVHVGLRYVSSIETLDIDTVQQPLRGKDLSVDKVTIEVQDSRGGRVGPVDDTGSDMLEIKPRFDEDGYDPLDLRSYKAEIFIQPSWNKGGRIRIEQVDPLPLAILSIIPNVSLGGI